MTTRTKPLRLKTSWDALCYLGTLGRHLTVDGTDVVESDACRRCGGAQRFNCWSHMEEGRCFECHGAPTANRVKRTPIIKFAKAARKVELAERRRVARREAAAGRALDGQRRWCAANGYGPITFAERDAVEAERRATLGHVGAVGAKLEIELTVTRITSFSKRYGYSETLYMVYIMEDDQGNVVKWVTSGDGIWHQRVRVWGLDNGETRVDEDNRHAVVGDRILVRGRVKDHGDWNGTKETGLKNVRVRALLAEGLTAKPADWDSEKDEIRVAA